MFSLSMPMTMSVVDTIKLALTKALPSVKSSHRCEAFARGLGYRTYAALRADAETDNLPIAAADGAAFVQYLAQHDFNVGQTEFYHAVAKAAVQVVVDQWPSLNINGFGTGERERGSDGRWESAAEEQKRLEAYRDDLLSDYALAPFLASLALVSRIERTKTVRPGTGSYKLKHIAENYACTYPDGETLGPVYVANGVLIAAAIHAGFAVKPYTDDYGREILNAGFNMSKTSIEDLDCEIRPDGGAAHARRARERRRASSRFTYNML